MDKIEKILNLLISAYGDRIPERRLEPVGELILTILSQNTSDVNSRRAFKSLTASFAGWDKVAHAPAAKIADSIRAGGLARVKSGYIKKALQYLEKDAGGYDLRFLKDMEPAEARAWLTRLPGVGMKTASCVLLFSLGMPAFPVDTHVLRVAVRLGLLAPKTTADAAHIEMEHLVPAADIYRCHVLMIEHGRRTCKAQRPLCGGCVLSRLCPSYNKFNPADRR
ncbi:MAG: endonuclease III [Dehalococcoidia bacterium]